MNLTKKEETFIKKNQKVIKDILSKRVEDYKDKIIKMGENLPMEEKHQRREILCCLAGEMESFISYIDNVVKKKKKDTGI